ncbi:Hypothetical predicted protein [Lecanosticta acicola]|uniref:Chitin synthesis regulation, Congo red resistance, RCR protein n=1 Tax=Lecanosticta acicola TaxID=111012 RepID=A0AAI9EFG7_9PEZI|nr:Hypothetical predicted protein [Lecanosticta acicola]
MAYRCYTNVYGGTYCRSTWDRWGRWVLLGVLVAAAILVFLISACIMSRRRRKAGKTPLYGTGWVPGSGKPTYPQQQNTYGNNYQMGQQQYPTQSTNNAPPQYNQSGGAANEYYSNGNVNNQYAQPGQYQPPAQPPPAHQRPTGWQ